MNEGTYQAALIKRIENLLPGCIVLKNDPSIIQGIPDLLVLWNDKWAALEVKASPKSNIQVNQEYYIETLGRMSYASFINPQNEELILDELQHSFGLTGQARVS